MKLVQIGDYWIDPTKVISVAPFGGPNDFNQFYINIDMGGWTASYSMVSDQDWNPRRVAAVVNQAVIS